MNAGSAVVGLAPPTTSWRHRWRSVAFAPVGNDIRRRRGSDGLRLVAAVTALLLCVLIIRYGYRVDSVITRVVNPPPASISWLVTLVYDAGAFGVTAVLVVLALIARRFEVARDIGLSVIGTGAVSGLLVLVLGATGAGGRERRSTVTASISRYSRSPRSWRSPPPAFRTWPELCSGSWRSSSFWSPWPRSSVATACHSTSWAAWPSAGGSPPSSTWCSGRRWDCHRPMMWCRLLQELGVAAFDVQPSEDQGWGVAHYRAAARRGATDRISVRTSPSPSTGAMRPTPSSFRRPAAFCSTATRGPTLTLTRLQQVEREAYLTMWARQVGAAVPEVVQAGRSGPSGDAVLVCLLPEGERLSDAPPEAR